MNAAPTDRRRGFSLIELLVSVVVLSLIVVLAASIVQLAARSWVSGKNQADNYAKARSTLDLIARELRAGVFRSDVQAFKDPSGEDDFRFLTRQAATRGDRGLLAVGYSVNGLGIDNPQPDELGLFRIGKRYNFDDRPDFATGIDFLPDPDTQQIGPGILAFTHRFYTRSGQPAKSFNFDHSNPQADSNTGTVRLACAVTDDRTLELLVSSGGLKPLAQALQNIAETSTGSPVAAWTEAVQQLVESGVIPAPVGAGIRMFEHTLRLPTSDA